MDRGGDLGSDGTASRGRVDLDKQRREIERLRKEMSAKSAAAVRPMMTLSLSCDHRLVDGARAAEFIQTLAGLLEAPAGI
ncbi:MAG: 2-oxo acid dehydrogenase subunit E2 [Candidatus Dormibacterales bacterium]